jgi:hypothetical protein
VLFESDLGELASGKKSGTDLFLGDYSEKDVENHLKVLFYFQNIAREH